MKHNHWAIVVAVIFQQLLCFVWYSEFFFLDAWLAASGVSPDALVFHKAHPMIATLISEAMFCYLLSWLFQLLVVDDAVRGGLVGALVGLGFLAPVLANHYLYLGFGPELVWVDASRQILASIGAGVILAIWSGERTEEDMEPVS